MNAEDQTMAFLADSTSPIITAFAMLPLPIQPMPTATVVSLRALLTLRSPENLVLLRDPLLPPKTASV